jgi:hypothetical protein
MRTLLSTVLLGLCMNASALLAATNGDEILGTWVTDSGEDRGGFDFRHAAEKSPLPPFVKGGAPQPSPPPSRINGEGVSQSV